MIMNMITNINPFIVYFTLILVGLCLGSFAGATVWRLRARQLVDDERNDDIDEIEKKELKHLRKLTKKSILKDHSQCLHCSYELKWFDLIPLVSWTFLKGKCRKCQRSIGYLEPLIEIGVALFFVISYAAWPFPLDSVLDIFRFAIWALAGVALAIAVAYDAKWFIIPDKVNFAVVGLGVVNSLIVILNSNDKLSSIFSIVGGIFILSGIYCFVYFISKGKWIGFGDVKLGLGLALMLANWDFAFVALFTANLIGCLVVIPPMLAGKLKRDSRIPFGPLLILGYLIAGLFGNYILNAYFSLLII